VKQRRTDEFRHTGRALTWWLIGLAAAPFALPASLAPRRSRRPPPPCGAAGVAAVTIALWCLLMFIPDSAIVHQGSYAAMLALFVIASACLETLIAGVAAGDVAAGVHPGVHVVGVLPGRIRRAASDAARARGLGPRPGRNRRRAFLRERPAAAPALTEPPPVPAPPPPCRTRIAHVVARPRSRGGCCSRSARCYSPQTACLAHAAALRQDGSIFLTFNDLDGAGRAHALHGLPAPAPAADRVGAPKLLDPAWWPAFYTACRSSCGCDHRADVLGAARATVETLSRARVLVVAHTGEVLFKHEPPWVTAFALIQQALIKRPTDAVQRGTDLRASR